MPITASFLINSILLGTGLAMDAFSVSIANALCEPQMRKRKMLAIAGTYSFFQFVMPLVGWLCVHTVVQYFAAFEKCVPYIALLLLGYIGGKSIYESLKGNREQADTAPRRLGVSKLLLQGIATSIDALSVGFTIEQYAFSTAVIACIIIGAVTFLLCMLALLLGTRFGTRLSRAEVFGGVILIAIGLEIFIKGVFF